MHNTILILFLLFISSCASMESQFLSPEEKIETAVQLVPQINSSTFRSKLKNYFSKTGHKAFAVNMQTGSWGRSWGYRNLYDAKDSALKNCKGNCVFLYINSFLQKKNFTIPTDNLSKDTYSPHEVKDFTETSHDSSDFSKKPILTIESGMHTGMINRIGVDPSSNFIITPSDDRTARLWNLSTGKLTKVFRIPLGSNIDGGMIQSAAISPNGLTAALGVIQNNWEKSSSILIIDLTDFKLKRKVRGLPDVPMFMDYSNDGKYLAASMYGNGGVQVFNTSNYTIAFQDRRYKKDSMGIDFSSYGQLIAASRDGYVRLYDSNFNLVAKKRIGKNKMERPYHVKFNGDGSLIAVGVENSTKVEILSGINLKNITTLKVNLSRKPNPLESIWAVCWSKNNKFLYAGGRLKEKDSNGKWQNFVYRWNTDNFQKQPVKIVADNATITTIQPYMSDGVVYGTTDPSWGVIDGSANKLLQKTTQLIDVRSNKSNILLSSDGLSVSYFDGYGKGNQKYFSLLDSNYTAERNNLNPPKMRSKGIKITKWNQEESPSLNGRKLKGVEGESRCYAISKNEEYFILGTSLKLHAFDKNGNLLWSRWSRGEVWGVNIAQNRNVFVAAMADGTIRWYDLYNGKELLSLFPHNDGKRWVAWTPEGFFDHSPGGDDLVGYHLNIAKNKLSKFINVSQVYDLFYRPDLIKKKLIGGYQHEIDDTITKIGDIRKIIGQGLPPEVRILSLENKISQDLSSVSVKVTLTEQGGGSGRIRYRANGIVVAEQNVVLLKGSGDNKTIDQTIRLVPGVNNIEVSSFDNYNNIEGLPVSTKIKTPQKKLPKGKLYILAIGIDKYKNSTLNLSYSVNDAEALTETFKKFVNERFYTGINEVKLYNQHATRNNIFSAFDTLHTKIRKEDLFILYIAGHGVTIDGKYYILPWETDNVTSPDAIKKVGLNTDTIQQLLIKIPARRSFVILDTCFSGGYKEDVYKALSQRAALGRFVRNTGRAILSASSEQQEAIEGYEGHGLFTYVLLDGLEGNADKNGNNNNEISINETANYVVMRVPKLSKKVWDYEQQPSFTYYGENFSLGPLLIQ